MKRLLLLILVFTLILTLCACSQEEHKHQVDVIEVPENINQYDTQYNVPANDLPEELPNPLGDDNFQIEGCKTTFEERDTYTTMRMNVKVRNLTSYNPPDNFALLYTPIDENGDALDGTILLGCTDIAVSGKAQWLETYDTEEGATGIRILGYQVYGGPNLKVYFDTPIELYSKDYKITYDSIKSVDQVADFAQCHESKMRKLSTKRSDFFREQNQPLFEHIPLASG